MTQNDQTIITEEKIEVNKTINITNDNFYEFKSNLSSGELFEVDSLILSDKDFQIFNCNIKKFEVTNCHELRIINSTISDAILTSTKEFANETQLGDICNSTISNCIFNNIQFININFYKNNFTDQLIFNSCNFKIIVDEESLYSKSYGLCLSFNKYHKIELNNCEGNIIYSDSIFTDLFILNNNNLNDLRILRCTGNKIIDNKNKISEFSVIQSNLKDYKNNTINSFEDAIHNYTTFATPDEINKNSILENKRIKKLFINSDNKKNIQLKNCFVELIEFEDESIVNIKIEIIDSVIDKIIGNPEKIKKIINFTGSSFIHPLKLNKTIFNKSFYLSQCTFINKLKLKNIIIEDTFVSEFVNYKGEYEFISSNVGKNLNLNKAQFEKKCTIKHSKITGQFQLLYSNFKEETYLGYIKTEGAFVHNNSTFEQKLKLDHNNIGGWYTGTECIYKGEYEFISSNVGKNLFLNKAQFEKKCTIEHSKITDAFQLSYSNFKEETYLGHIKTEGAFIHNNSTFEQKLKLDHNNIGGWYAGAECIYKGEYEFISSKVGEDLFLNKAQFDKKCTIRRIKIEGLLSINKVKFNENIEMYLNDIKQIMFSNLEFGENSEVLINTNNIVEIICNDVNFPIINFSDNIVSGNAFFGTDDSCFGSGKIATSFKEISSFENTKFKGKTLFNNCLFEKNAFFYNTQLEGEAHFDNAKFLGCVDFRTGFSQNDLTFANVYFYKSVNFDGFLSDKRVSISSATFIKNNATLSISQSFFNSIDLNKSQIMEEDLNYNFIEIIFGIKLYRKIFNQPKVRSILFDEAMIKKYRTPDYRFNLSSSKSEKINKDSLTEIIVEGFKIRHSEFKKIMANEVEKIEVPNKSILTNSIVDDYLGLKEAFGKSGKSEDQDWAYFQMMHHKAFAQIHRKLESKRKTLFLDKFQLLPEYLKLFFFEYLFGWGVRMIVIARTSTLCILIFTLLFTLVGTDTNIQLDNKIIPPSEQNVLIMLNLSIQSFFTVLLGDYNPQSLGPLKNLVIIESVIGIFVMTFLVGAYTRKILRD